MARPRRTDLLTTRREREVARRTKDAIELRQALAVLLPAECGCTLEQTAKVLGVGRATVPRLQAGFRDSLGASHPLASRRAHWGGRRRALMSEQQEREFLAPWAEQAKQYLFTEPVGVIRQVM